MADGGTTTLTTEHEGELLIATQPVTQGDETGALVIVTYLDEERAGLRDTMRTYLVVAVLTLLLITALAAWQSGRLLAPLRTLRSTAEEITESDLSQRIPETGNDDITALTRTVNGMLDRLEAAFVGQRQFLDDAGHELKTPLTVLRGHLELLDTGSPQEVAETRALLLDEVDRMSRLVGDLILLAKSNRPDFLNPRRVDARRPGVRGAGQGARTGRPGVDRRPRHPPRAVDGRAADHPGAAPARRQRGQAHRRTATRSASDRRTTAARCGSGSATPGRASPTTTATRSSSGSAAAGSPTTTRASAWACRSWPRSPGPMVVVPWSRIPKVAVLDS